MLTSSLFTTRIQKTVSYSLIEWQFFQVLDSILYILYGLRKEALFFQKSFHKPKLLFRIM